MLEQRQKEVIELCKSDTDDEENEQENEEKVENISTNSINDTESSSNPQSFQNVNDVNCLNIDKEYQNDNKTEQETDKEISNDNIKETDLLENETVKEQVNTSENNKETPILLDIESCIDNELSKQKESESMNVTNEEMEIQSEVNLPSVPNSNIDDESQVLALHYDSEKTDNLNKEVILKDTNVDQPDNNEMKENGKDNSTNEDSLEDEVNYDEIEEFIAKAESIPS